MDTPISDAVKEALAEGDNLFYFRIEALTKKRGFPQMAMQAAGGPDGIAYTSYDETGSQPEQSTTNEDAASALRAIADHIAHDVQ